MWPKGKDWLLLLKLKLQPYHGGEFVCNDCHKLLKNMDVLQTIVEREKATCLDLSKHSSILRVLLAPALE